MIRAIVLLSFLALLPSGAQTVTMTAQDASEWWTFESPTTNNSIIWVDLNVHLTAANAEQYEQAERWLKDQFRELIPELGAGWSSRDLPLQAELQELLIGEVERIDLTANLAQAVPDTAFTILRVQFYDCH